MHRCTLPCCIRYASNNLQSRLETYGSPKTLAYTLGRTVPSEDSKVPDRHLETTNQLFFSELPKVRLTREINAKGSLSF